MKSIPYLAPYYINNSGSRWINTNNGNKEKVKVCFPEKGNVNGWVIKEYTVAYWEAIGNFAVAYVKIKGKREQLTEWDGENNIFMINNSMNATLRNRSYREKIIAPVE